MLKKGYFCQYFWEFIITDIDIKLVGLNKYTLQISHIKFFLFILNTLHAKMIGKRNSSKSRYVADGVDISITAHRKRKNRKDFDSVWLWLSCIL